MALGDKRTDPKTGEPEIEIAGGAWVTDWISLTALALSSGGNTPFEISVSHWSTLERVTFQTEDRRSEINRVSPVYVFTKENLTEDHDGWVFEAVSATHHRHTKETPGDYFFQMDTVVDTAADTAIITLSETHATQPNTFGAVINGAVSYDAAGPSIIPSVTTARYQPNHDYTAGDPILEPNPADNFEPYTWTADEDFTSGADPDFDGTGFTPQAKGPSAIGLETDIVGQNNQPKVFSGDAISKANDITQDVNQVIRLFRAPLAQIIYGHGADQMLNAIDPADGKVYTVRDGVTDITSNDNPSANPNEWHLLSEAEPRRIALADLQALRFPDLVARTSLSYYIVDTRETVVWDVTATPENVAPRKTYVAAETVPPVADTAGRWIVTSPSQVTGQIFLDTVEKAIPNANTNIYVPTANLPDLQLGDEIQFTVKRGTMYHTFSFSYLGENLLHESSVFSTAGNVNLVWIMSVAPDGLHLRAAVGGGTQAVAAIRITR